MATQRPQTWLFAAVALSGLSLTDCSRQPVLAVTADTLPAPSRSLAVSVTRLVEGGAQQATAEALATYDLPSPTPTRQSFLLRVPSGFADTINVSLAAFGGAQGSGCLLRTGQATHTFAPQPYDDSVVVPLDVDVSEKDCDQATPAWPRLSGANPAQVGTAGGDVVTLRGWGFAPGVEVYFDDVKSTDVRYVSGYEITALTPAHSKSGSTNVRVVLPGGSMTARADLVRYRYSTINLVPQSAISVPFTLSRTEIADA